MVVALFIPPPHLPNSEVLENIPNCFRPSPEHQQGGVCGELPAGEHLVHEAAGLRHGLLVQRTAQGPVPQTRGEPIGRARGQRGSSLAKTGMQRSHWLSAVPQRLVH